MMSSSVDIFSVSKTEQIMSRYRPIAPKPQFMPQNPALEHSPPSENPHQSRFTRPVRGRKRNRTGNSTVTNKRSKILVAELSSDAAALAKDKQLAVPLHGFGQGLPGFPFPSTGFHESSARTSGDLLTHPLLPYACSVPPLARSIPLNGPNMESMSMFKQVEEKVLDLNCNPEIQEKDLLPNLHVPFAGSKNSACSNLVVPKPVRPVGSSISVGCISEGNGSASAAPVSKKPEEVEEEVESEALPSVISDSNNKVRLANSAYKEMVGQPECPWLDSMVIKDGRLRATSKRISGKVMLDLPDSSVPASSNGFSCRVKIEWACNGQKIFVNAPCDVIRLSCESKDYLFTWKFHTSEVSDTKC